MKTDFKNLAIAIMLSIAVLGGWQFFYESPRRDRLEQIAAETKASKVESSPKASVQNMPIVEEIKSEEAGRLFIDTDKLEGSISLQGLRFDNLLLKGYKQTINKDSNLVELFSNKGSDAYFAEFGWINGANNNVAPDKNSIWSCDAKALTIDNPVQCYWSNKNSVYYFINISVDKDYLFTIKQTVENKSSNSINIANYGRIYKAQSEPKQFAILHEGAIGVFSDVLKESTYEDLSKERQAIYTNTKGSWAGITSKYWLSALVPDDNLQSKTNFIASSAVNAINPHDVYNINYISQDMTLIPGANFKSVNYLFAGAKQEKILSLYEQTKDFVLFDRAIDFGIFYFITKPLALFINYLHSILGNFGLAILGVTLLIKLLMYPLANKSFSSMARMKELQPKIDQIKKSCGDDKMKLNKEMMALYKKENINPAAGCLPLLIQIPVFFSLYKVIFISLEMRHAPFYGWIHDLSVPDPTAVWNLFGLIPWQYPSFLPIVGAWPLIMGLTMFVQQKLGPTPTDPVQASVMKFMPVLLVAMLYSLPAGLMIYWSFSNILSILQQYTINKTAELKAKKKLEG